jgi:hypothetical protein
MKLSSTRTLAFRKEECPSRGMHFSEFSLMKKLIITGSRRRKNLYGELPW